MAKDDKHEGQADSSEESLEPADEKRRRHLIFARTVLFTAVFTLLFFEVTSSITPHILWGIGMVGGLFLGWMWWNELKHDALHLKLLALLLVSNSVAATVLWFNGHTGTTLVVTAAATNVSSLTLYNINSWLYTSYLGTKR